MQATDLGLDLEKGSVRARVKGMERETGWATGTATETGLDLDLEKGQVTGSVKETAMERERVRDSEKDLETGMG